MADDTSQLDFIDEVQRTLGARYGGMWIDGDAYNVDVVSPTTEDEAKLASSAPAGSTVSIYAAKYSYDDLSKYSASVADQLTKAGLKFVSVGPDPAKGLVLVTGADENQTKSVVGDSVPPDALTFQSGGEWEAAELRADYPPYRAGRTLYFPRTQVRCSAGIAMVSELSGNLIQGSTAGHCERDGEAVHSGGAPNWSASVGVTNLNVYTASNPAYGDAELIGPVDQADMTRKIFETATSFSRIVVDKYTNAELVPGVPLCKTGVGGDTNCGSVVAGYPQEIDESNPSGVGGDRTVENLVFVDVDGGCPSGDSGGGVYHKMVNNQARAAGDISAHFLDQYGQLTNRCAFDPVQNIGTNTSSHVWRS